MQQRMQRFIRTTVVGLRSVNRATDKMVRGLRTGAVAMGASLAILGVGLADVAKTGATFEQSIVNAAVKFPGVIRKGSEAFQELSDAAREMGRTTEFTASQAAEALNFLAFAGFSAEQSIASLPKVIDLATASQTDLARATDITTDTLGAVGLMTKDVTQLEKNLTRVNDVLVATTTTANVNMEALFETVKEAGPVGTMAGQSLETIAGLAAAIGNAGIKGSRGGTTLKNMFLRLVNPVGAARKELRRLGVELKDSEGNFLQMIDVLDDIRQGFARGELGTADMAAVIDLIFGKRAVAGASTMLTLTNEELIEVIMRIKEMEVSSKEMAATMRDTVQTQFLTLKSAIESVKISIFDLNKGSLSNLLDNTIKWVRANEDLVAIRVTDFIDGIVLHLDDILRVGKKVLIFLGTFMGLLIGLQIFTTVVTAIALLATPVGLVTAGVFLLVGAIALAVTNWDDLRAAIENPMTVDNQFLRGLAVIANAFETILGWMTNLRKEQNFFVSSNLQDRLANTNQLGRNLRTRGSVPPTLGAPRTNPLTIVPRVAIPDIPRRGVPRTVSPLLFPKAPLPMSARPSTAAGVPGRSGPQVVSANDAVLRSVSEKRTTNRIDLNILDPGGNVDRSKLPGPGNNPAVGIHFPRSSKERF
jgi:TP901 family phage tail tape measure protein